MKKKTIIFGVTLAILAILLLVGGYTANKFYTRPQAPTLSLAMVTKIVSTVTPTDLPVIQSSPTSLPEFKPSPTSPQPTPKPTALVSAPTQESGVCGQTGAWIVMVLGRSTHTQPGGTQSIRLVKVDFDHKSVLVYSLPPGLALDTPGLVKDYNIKYSYLEDIFPRITKQIGQSQDTDFKATQALAQVILDNFGVPAEHYMTIDDTVVMEAVDAIGGIDVELPESFTMPEDSKYKGQVLKAGLQHFDGEMLHAYVSTFESKGGEFSRLSRQNVVLESLRKALMNPAILLKIFELYSAYKENVVTDLSLEQMTSLGCLAGVVSRDQISMKEPQIGEILYWEDGSMHFKDLASTANQLQALFGGSEK
jgi:anionic cell wall polymer biosynthesis LytR-Cps2A-Psr (LCP) family protein